MVAFANVFGKCLFGLGLVLSLLPAWGVTVVARIVKAGLPESRRASFQLKVSGWLIAYLVLAWRALFRICPWIQLHTILLDENFLGESGRPTVLVMNHLSFLDSVLAVPMAPLHRCADVRVLVANYVFAIPLLGGVMRAIGLAEVPFKASAGDFSSLAVEKDAMEEKLKAFAEHVQGGGVGAWFPEGMRNRGDPLVLQEFRAGAFSVAVQTDVDVWCLAMLGTNVCWPVESLVGGIPARIGIRMWKLGSSHALLAAESLPDCDTRTKAIRLAGLVKASIQEGLEDLAAKGFSDQRNARNEEAKSK